MSTVLGTAHPPTPQLAMVLRCLDNPLGTQHRRLCEALKSVARRMKVCVVSETLQDFGEDQVPHNNEFSAEKRVEMVNLGTVGTVEVVDPHASV